MVAARVDPDQTNGASRTISTADPTDTMMSRLIDGIRRSLIVNYVRAEWRSRRELAFLDRFAAA